MYRAQTQMTGNYWVRHMQQSIESGDLGKAAREVDRDLELGRVELDVNSGLRGQGASCRAQPSILFGRDLGADGAEYLVGGGPLPPVALPENFIHDTDARAEAPSASISCSLGLLRSPW